MLPVAVGAIAGAWIALLFARSLGALVFEISPARSVDVRRRGGRADCDGVRRVLAAGCARDTD
jgi:hypothetical protein